MLKKGPGIKVMYLSPIMHLGKAYAIGCLICVWCLYISCSKAHHTVTRGFYYWKTAYKPTGYEIKRLGQLQVRNMYIRMFDVDWDNANKQLMPIAPAALPSCMDTSFSYIPVVFITQKVLANITDTPAIAKAGNNIASLLNDMCLNAGIVPAEIQIDCDWAAGSRDVYFQLLRNLRQQLFFKGKAISCTIRLHQVKYTVSNGIPPVDKGLLMCYNMGNLKKAGVSNSILDVDEAEEYFGNLNSYPLPLDIALPLFNWCLIFEGEQFKGILRNVPPESIMHSTAFRHTKGNLYGCLKDTLWDGYHLKANDIIRVEGPSVKDLSAIASYTSSLIKNSAMSVVFFHCDSLTLNKFSYSELEKVYDIFN